MIAHHSLHELFATGQSSKAYWREALHAYDLYRHSSRYHRSVSHSPCHPFRPGLSHLSDLVPCFGALRPRLGTIRCVLHQDPGQRAKLYDMLEVGTNCAGLGDRKTWIGHGQLLASSGFDPLTSTVSIA